MDEDEIDRLDDSLESLETDRDDEDEDEDEDEDGDQDNHSFSSRLSVSCQSSHFKECLPPFSYHSFRNSHFTYVSNRSSVISIPTTRSLSISSSCSLLNYGLKTASDVPTNSKSSPVDSIISPPSSPSSPQTACTSISTEHHQQHRVGKTLYRSTSTDCLYQLLRSSKEKEKEKENKKDKEMKKETEVGMQRNNGSIYSNLTSSLKTWKNKLSNISGPNLVNLVNSSTDDSLACSTTLNISIQHFEPSTETEESFSIEQGYPPQELITFFEDRMPTPNDSTGASSNPDSSTSTGISSSDSSSVANDKFSTRPPFKNRDSRINPHFLRLYAYDYNARVNSHTLPNSLTQDDLIRIVSKKPDLKSFHYQYNLYRVSNMSREKLWNNVVLKPRKDGVPFEYIDCEHFEPEVEDFETNETLHQHQTDGSSVIRFGRNCDNYVSITRKEGKYLPWDLKPSIKPAGVLPNGKWTYNGPAPNSGVTRTQFTVRGWCDSRWRDCSKD